MCQEGDGTHWLRQHIRELAKRSLCWASLIIQELELQTTPTYQNGSHQKRQEIANAGEAVGESEPWCAVGGYGHWCSHHGKEYESFSEN